MRYSSGHSVIRSLVRVSKPGKRLYTSYTNFFKENTSFGILTTSKGMLNSYEALVLKQGGELLFNVS